MRFAALVALAGYASASCVTNYDCPEKFYGPGACCGRLSVGPFFDGNFGAFKKYIWGLSYLDDMKEGHSVTLCLPKTYLDAHAACRGFSYI